MRGNCFYSRVNFSVVSAGKQVAPVNVKFYIKGQISPLELGFYGPNSFPVSQLTAYNINRSTAHYSI